MIKQAITIFLLLNAFGTLPLFLALTKQETLLQKARTAMLAVLSASILLAVFIVIGQQIMQFFGLSIAAFEIGGGIILFKIGMEMINCSIDLEKILKTDTNETASRSNAVVPLGIPLLAGPGSMSVVMTMTIAMPANASGSILLALAVASVMSFAVWLAGGYIFTKFKGQVIRDLIAKLGGFLLLILAVQMIINGAAKTLAAII